MIQPFHSAVARKRVSGGGPTLVKYEDFEASASEYVALSSLAGWSDKIAGINVYWAGEIPAFPKVAYPGATTDSLTYYSSGASSLNQSVSGTLTALGTGVFFIGPAVRVQAGSNDCYYVLTDGDVIALNKRIGGTESNILTPVGGYGLVVGDKIQLVVSGTGAATRLTVKEDTGSGFTNITGLVNIDPGDYLGTGFGGISGYGNGTGTTLDDWYWYND